MSFFDGIKYFKDFLEFFNAVVDLIKNAESSGANGQEKRDKVVQEGMDLLFLAFPQLKGLTDKIKPLFGVVVSLVVEVINFFWAKKAV